MKITKIRFFEYGQKPPKNSRFKDTISNETIGGYFDYTGREEAKEVLRPIEVAHHAFDRVDDIHHQLFH